MSTSQFVLGRISLNGEVLSKYITFSVVCSLHWLPSASEQYQEDWPNNFLLKPTRRNQIYGSYAVHPISVCKVGPWHGQRLLPSTMDHGNYCLGRSVDAHTCRSDRRGLDFERWRSISARGTWRPFPMGHSSALSLCHRPLLRGSWSLTCLSEWENRRLQHHGGFSTGVGSPSCLLVSPLRPPHRCTQQS
jgi:hypothetical protein